jgi:hypothetical protein
MDRPPPPTKHFCALLGIFCAVAWALASYQSKKAFWADELETARHRQAVWCGSLEAMAAQKTHDRCAQIAEDLKLTPHAYAVLELSSSVSPTALLSYLGSQVLAVIALAAGALVVSLLREPFQYLFNTARDHSGPMIPMKKRE